MSVVAATALAVGACGSGDADPRTSTSPTAVTQTAPVTRGATPSSPTVVEPIRLSVPSIKVSAELVAVEAKDNVVSPPAGAVAWVRGYDRVLPGEVGTSVVTAHVIEGKKAGPFVDLQELDKGDTVSVTDATGAKVVYTVTETRVATKKQVSTDPGVWGENRDTKRLALITCDDDGGFRPDGHRVSNFVAIAEAA
ncbi:LPXTG-site transpeptidase (sortase) family protein [Knoellia remsis]|uniref:LPXTG-site transpeptidase (Sortase) family protein n=1 Tax=Knoellia remsis TaxID=407159 RepID=A0A2T0UNL2_9MICO|nr:class F sortase [Knoellia remsis]PRY59494.1 LPXTG-site transpeptidase (sortase) family protein [Knoellia remsis]